MKEKNQLLRHVFVGFAKKSLTSTFEVYAFVAGRVRIVSRTKIYL